MSRRPDQSSVRPDQSSARPTQSQAPQSAYQQSAPQSRPPTSAASASAAPQQSRPPTAASSAASAAAAPQQSRPPTSAASAFDPRQAIQQQRPPQQSPQQPVQKYNPIDDRARKIVPSERIMMEATVIALKVDKPIILTFWHDSIMRNVYVVHNPREKETIIEKVKEHPDDELECTSRIVEDYRNGIFETENSIYIVVPDIQKR